MIKPDQVPPAAMYEAWKSLNAGMTINDAICAAINAWPGMSYRYRPNISLEPQEIILPLTESADDK